MSVCEHYTQLAAEWQRQMCTWVTTLTTGQRAGQTLVLAWGVPPAGRGEHLWAWRGADKLLLGPAKPTVAPSGDHQAACCGLNCRLC